MLKIEEATKELENKSHQQIHEETAWKWASRAAASYERILKLNGLDAAIELTKAEDFYGEAREHASQVSGELVQKVIDSVDVYMRNAFVYLNK